MAIDVSPQSSTELPHKSQAKAQKELVEELKIQWKLLWSERFNDKIRAEGVSVSDYIILRVERGTIIHATRDFKALNFREILQQNMIEEPDRFIQPDLNVGGWGKFIKKEITNAKPKKSRAKAYIAKNPPNKNAAQQAKKGGRGWLHST
jgi:hypothetical protein